VVSTELLLLGSSFVGLTSFDAEFELRSNLSEYFAEFLWSVLISFSAQSAIVLIEFSRTIRSFLKVSMPFLQTENSAKISWTKGSALGTKEEKHSITRMVVQVISIPEYMKTPPLFFWTASLCFWGWTLARVSAFGTDENWVAHHSWNHEENMSCLKYRSLNSME
jgi:hypothetical protein